MATKSAGEKTLPFRYQFAAGAVAGISEVMLQTGFVDGSG
jgi:hypothetical protein